MGHSAPGSCPCKTFQGDGVVRVAVTEPDMALQLIGKRVRSFSRDRENDALRIGCAGKFTF